MIFNAHLHLNKEEKPIYAGFYNTTSESEWDSILSVYNRSKQIIPAIGIHPWYVAEASQNWAEKMADLLAKHSFLQVGEIGLDSLKPDLQQQEHFFTEQLRLARKFNRIVNIHAVHTTDKVCALIKKFYYPLPFILHNYHGSRVITQKATQLNGYFSLGPAFSEKHLADIPLNRLLLETDLLDSALLKENAHKIAWILGIKPEQLEQQLFKNVKDLFNGIESF